MERVVVTGCGIASPLGCTVADFWNRLLAGCSGIAHLASERYSEPLTGIGALVSELDEQKYFDHKAARRMSRSSKLALVAAAEAIAMADLNPQTTDLTKVGVIVGSSIGGFSASDFFFKEFYLNNRTNPRTIPLSMNTGPASNISIHYGLGGPLMSVDGACASAAHSLGYAFMLIRTGMLPMAVTGGADSPFSAAVVASWHALGVLSKRHDHPAAACRPFSLDRDGMVLGEGAGILVLESESSALRRGHQILAEIVGYGATGDSLHLTAPSMAGSVRAMDEALRLAELKPQAIDYVNAHATATPLGDKNETMAMKEVFGPHAYQMPIVGNKAALGHSMAASGALELIGCIMALRDQRVPPTINYTTFDPDCDLDYVTEGSRQCHLRYIMSNSFAFGGSNASLIIKKYEPTPS
ncbi:beta-ketoacyl-ACP synthase II [soil metagenome]